MISVFNLIALSLFFNISLGCIYHKEIRTENASLIFIDDFDFSEDGRIELNISEISLPNPNVANLSNIGFFVTRRTYDPIDRIFDEYEASSRCFLDPSYRSFRIPLKRVYTFDQLQNCSSSVNILFNDTLINLLDYNDTYVDDIEFNVFYPRRLELYFQTCVLDGHVSINVRSAMYDETNGGLGRRYIPSSLSPSYFLYLVLIILYIWITAKWIYADIDTHRWKFSSIYFLVSFALVLQVFSIILELSYTYHIVNTGETRDWGVSICAFISALFKETPIPTLIASLSTTAKLSKPNIRLKDILPIATILISLLVTTTARLLFIGPWQCGPLYCFPMLIFRAADSFIPMFVVSHTQWYTFRHLLQAGKAEGQSAQNLAMIHKTNGVMVAYLCYHYFTFIFISMLEYTPSIFYPYSWKSVFLRELATLSLYMIIEYAFWPQAPRKNTGFSHQDQTIALQAINQKIVDTSNIKCYL